MRLIIAAVSFIIGVGLCSWSIYTSTPMGVTIAGALVLFDFVFVYEHNTI